MSKSKARPPVSIIRTLIVDDSAFVRKVVRDMLARSPFIEVIGMARDGVEALAMVEELKPDVVTCDLTMPRMDGVKFVREQMERKSIPILILTASPHDGESVLEAISAGAVDLVRKPTALASNDLLAVRDELIEKVKAAARVTPQNIHPALPIQPPSSALAAASKVDIVLIGISTGGPQALRYLLPQIPPDFPVAIAIVLHMPDGYTAMLAEKLNALSHITVKEAEEGDPINPGTILLGQAGRHLLLRKNALGQPVAHLSMQPLDKPHRPSVDVLFESAAELYGERVLAVVMTGMGDDGRLGSQFVKRRGGTVLTETEESCVIYGMPRAVVEAGLSDAGYPLTSMVKGIIQHL